jgi:hypothetical protein
MTVIDGRTTGVCARRPLSPATIRWWLSALIAIAWWGITPPAGASPSRYTYEICDSVLPGGGVDGVVYGPHPRGLFSSENTCGQSGGALVVRQNDIKEGDGGDADWAIPVEAPPGAGLEAITITAKACGVTDPSIYSGQWIQPAGSWPGTGCAEDVRSFRMLNETEAFFYIKLHCQNGISEDHCNAGPLVLGHYFAITIVDSAPPKLAAPSGSLLSGGVKRGHQSVEVSAEDAGGGLSGASVLVNGQQSGGAKAFSCNVAVADNPSVTGTVAVQITPCPTKGEASWSLDTGSHPFHDGANSVRVCASDFATLSDPNTSCSAPQTVIVDNSCAESAVPGGEVLSAQFERSNAEEVTVGYGKPAVVSGRLADNAGDPIRGAKLCVKMAMIGVDDRAGYVGSVTTDADGRYRYQVAAGPNREVTIGYRHDASQVARGVRYYAHAGPTLKVNDPRVANGDRVRFRGVLPGPRNAGRVVVLQAGTVGSKRWITFRKSTARSHGVFRANYHFTHTTRRTRYRFRAVVPRQAGYPWVAGQSKPVTVIVRPGG